VCPSATATHVLSVAGAGGTATRQVTVRVVSVAAEMTVPFGSFDTPANGASGVTGAIPVTGWALDDVRVAKVEIHRSALAGEPTSPNGLVYVGDATFVPGARPDVATAFANFPLASRAGWGYMLLTNFLPSGGNGTFTLHAYASDDDGQSTRLGSKTITCSNATATKPFGTIDTPGQGETVSGTIVNFGWALTPMPASIPTDGSTIQVYVDGAAVGQPVYNQYRSDIATLFPGYANTNGAVGFYSINTGTLSIGFIWMAFMMRCSRSWYNSCAVLLITPTPFRFYSSRLLTIL